MTEDERVQHPSTNATPAPSAASALEPNGSCATAAPAKRRCPGDEATRTKEQSKNLFHIELSKIFHFCQSICNNLPGGE